MNIRQCEKAMVEAGMMNTQVVSLSEVRRALMASGCPEGLLIGHCSKMGEFGLIEECTPEVQEIIGANWYFKVKLKHQKGQQNL